MGKFYMKKLFFLCALLFSFFFNQIAHAQEFKDKEYLEQVQSFTKGPRSDELLEKMRETYVDTSFYDGMMPPQEIGELGKAIKSKTMKEGQSIPVTENFMALLDSHLFFLNVLSDAGVKEDDPGVKFHLSMIHGIVRLIKKSGDGKTPKTAYKALNKTEQIFFIRSVLGRDYNGKGLQNVDGEMFDVYEAFDTKDKDKKTEAIYFNITRHFQKGRTIRDIAAAEKKANELKTQEGPVHQTVPAIP